VVEVPAGAAQRLVQLLSLGLAGAAPAHLALAAALGYAARGVVEDAQHGDDAVGRAVGAADVGPRGARVVDGQPDV
jgi:hypothetical protein